MSDLILAACVMTAVMSVVGIAIMVSRRGPVVMPAPPVAARVGQIEDRLGVVEVHLKAQDESLKLQDHDLRNIRMSLAAMPTKDIVHKMDIELTALTGKVVSLDVQLTANSRMLERIHDYLMKTKLGQD